MGRKAKDTYCICLRGKRGDGTGWMIYCEECHIWFHGPCIGLTKDSVDEDKDWFCETCLKTKFSQCHNPICRNATRNKDSKYCSDECGIQLNKLRYDRFFKPNWAQLEEKHSAGRFMRLSEMSRLEKEKEEVIKLIGKLKVENEELVNNIAIIKEKAKEMSNINRAAVQQNDDDSNGDPDDQEEFTSSDQIKVFCVICGISQPGEKVFKHWASCHRKQESVFNFTSDVPIRLGVPDVDEDPHLYCQKQDKKTKRYCMNIQSACPQHSNWHIDNDEICGCPAYVGQDLVPDGNYCLELKKDCRLHYNWDKFRIAAKNMERIQAYNRLETLNDKINRTQMSLNDTYGGVIGVMKHHTRDHEHSANTAEHDHDIDMLDV